MASLIALAMVVMIVDCSAGHWVYYHGTITNHRYVPESTTVSTDSDGNITTDTDPEEFHLGFCSDDGQTLDISTTQEVFNGTQDGQQVWVKTRKGKLGHYLNHIVDEPPTAEK